MDVKQLRYFLKVCEDGSFSNASTALYISQQGLGASIKKIEDELGVPLFIRTPKGIILTEYAKLLVPYAQDFCHNYESLLTEIETLKKSKLGKINIAISLGLLGTYSVFSFETFRTKNPHIELNVSECNDMHAMSQILNYDTEIAIVSGPVDPSLFNSITLKTGAHTLLVGAEHHLAKKGSIAFSDLQDEKIISLYENFNIYYNFVERCHLQGFEPNIVSKTVDIFHLYNLCKLNKGVGISVDIANKHFALDNILAIPFSDSSYVWEADIIYKKNHQLSDIAQKVIDYLISIP